jgi:hypothetical protein
MKNRTFYKYMSPITISVNPNTNHDPSLAARIACIKYEIHSTLPQRAIVCAKK